MATVAGFEDIRIVDNFYQTSAFFPMPVVAVATLDERGETNIGPYSLCFPYYVAGKAYYGMLLEARNNSNTAENILRTGRCTLNFLPDVRRLMKECVELGFPGETTAEKMAHCSFSFVPGLRSQQDPEGLYPEIVQDAFQVFECEWDRELENADRFSIQESYEPPYNNFNGITSESGAHFILKITNILLKPRYKEAILGGLKARLFPKVPVDYGYRDNTNFWFADFKLPYSAKIPRGKATAATTVHYAANRIDPDITFTMDACEKLVRVPRVFLNKALEQCVQWAKDNGVTTVLPEHMDQIRDKRAQEKAR